MLTSFYIYYQFVISGLRNWQILHNNLSKIATSKFYYSTLSYIIKYQNNKLFAINIDMCTTLTYLKQSLPTKNNSPLKNLSRAQAHASSCIVVESGRRAGDACYLFSEFTPILSAIFRRFRVYTEAFVVRVRVKCAECDQRL